MDFPVELSPKHREMAQSLSIDPTDISEHFIRGGGPGGQKINRTSSCVELRHVPTGVFVKVQRFREQSRNRTAAYTLLIEKIEERIRGEASQRAQERHKIRKQKQRRSRKAKRRMLEEKKLRGALKKERKSVL